jgi:signal transduction histidine kinase
VRDDGVGGGTDRSGRGLTGLGDRVAAAGGVVDVAAAPGGGTSVRAVLAPSPRPARNVP